LTRYNFASQDIEAKFNAYPKAIKISLLAIRELIFNTAKQSGAGELEESLKWGEPSYSSKFGSPIRIDWKEKSSEFLGIYFNCNTKLVETFRELYPSDFEYQKNRAILLPTHTTLPKEQLGHCIELALLYKQRKHLPLLGASPQS
jgi:hypothetical protein